MLSILKQQEETWFNFIALLYWMVCLSSSTFLNHCLIVSPPDATFSSTLWSRCSKGSPCRRFDIAFFWETGERRLFTFHLKTTCPSLFQVSLSLSLASRGENRSKGREDHCFPLLFSHCLSFTSKNGLFATLLEEYHNNAMSVLHTDLFTIERMISQARVEISSFDLLYLSWFISYRECCSTCIVVDIRV